MTGITKGNLCVCWERERETESHSFIIEHIISAKDSRDGLVQHSLIPTHTLNKTREWQRCSWFFFCFQPISTQLQNGSVILLFFLCSTLASFFFLFSWLGPLSSQAAISPTRDLIRMVHSHLTHISIPWKCFWWHAIHQFLKNSKVKINLQPVLWIKQKDTFQQKAKFWDRK